MRNDDFPLDLVSLQLDDYDVVQQQAEQHKDQVSLHISFTTFSKSCNFAKHD